ncbi:uncharacterized protein LOC134834357 [Culicoides brevitarsis]|uniref:uncharacterized protein LOC134834357 n=1 Tax=Culicoides brevitarsis TaxID=469753 RepID=UPI00307B70EC
MVVINKLCPVLIVVVVVVVISYATNAVNGQQSFLHNNDQFPVDGVVNRFKRTTTFDGDAIEVNVDARRQAKAAIVNQSAVPEDRTARIRRSKQDLCQHLCTCDTEGTEKFVTVSCSFLMDKEYILGSNFFIQNNTRRLRITLSDKTTLRLDDGFFQQNNVASVQITGLVGNGGQIEITKYAFAQNIGIYPEITINRCAKLILKEFAFRGMTDERVRELKVNVTNCREVFVTKDAFSNTRFALHLDNIEHLGLFEGAFAGSIDGKVDISNVHMEEITSIGASLKMFQLKNSSVKKITNGAFSVVSIDSLVFENSKIDRIEKGSVAEKLFCKYMAIIGCEIDTIESNAIDGSGIMDFELNENKINVIEKQAFVGTALSTSVHDNTIKSVGYHWLSMRDWTNITIHNNTFGEWSVINIGKTSNPETCVFSRNFITKLAPGSLNFNHTSCKYRELSFFTLCNCNTEWLDKLSPVKLIGESFCRVDDALKHCFNSTTFNVQRYLDQVCDTKAKQLDCMKNMNLKKVEGKFISPEEIRETTKMYILIGIIGVLFLIAVIFTLVVYFACKKCCSGKEETEDYLLTGRSKRAKTFSDEDRKIIINTLDTMKLTESHALYSRVYNHTQKLMDGGLDETEKVLCIGEIVHALNEKQNHTSDYIAFTDILSRQLRPMESAPPESELDDITLEETNDVNIQRQSHHNNEHIYAEPQLLCGAQKPLLNNDYSLPMDKDNEALPLYSEPIRKIKSPPEPLPRMATPYAIGNATNIVQLTPTDAMIIESPTAGGTNITHKSQQNLPDILYQSVNNNNKKFSTTTRRNESTEVTPPRV